MQQKNYNSLQIREFQQTIINYKNSIQLPAEVKRLVFLEIFSQIEKETNLELQKEILERNASEQEKAQNE